MHITLPVIRFLTIYTEASKSYPFFRKTFFISLRLVAHLGDCPILNEILTVALKRNLNSVSDPVSKAWYRVMFDQSKLQKFRRPTRLTSDRIAIHE